MGKKVIDGDYAKPLFTRIYECHRYMLDYLAAILPFVKLKYPKKGGPYERPQTDAEIIKIAIEELYESRTTEMEKTRDIHHTEISPRNRKAN